MNLKKMWERFKTTSIDAAKKSYGNNNNNGLLI